MILRGRTRPHGVTTTPTQELVAESDSYDEAIASLYRQVPDGWDLLHVTRD